MSVPAIGSTRSTSASRAVAAKLAPTLSYTGTTYEAPARMSRLRHDTSVTRATMRSDGAIARAVSATTALEGSSRLVIKAAARSTPAARITVASRASPSRKTAPAASTACSTLSSVSITSHCCPLRIAASAAARPTLPKPATTTWSCKCSRTLVLLFSRSAARTSPDKNNAVSVAAEYT